MFTLENIGKISAPFIKMILILIIGHFLIVYIAKIAKRAFLRGKLDQSLADFLVKTINIVLHILVVLSALTSVGVSTTGIIAAFSAAAVAVSLALKDSLGNVAGGILLLISPRFTTGDFIETENDAGTVLNVDLLHTTIVTADHKQVSIPNGILINSHIINYSIESERRVDITFPISYSADVETAKSVILKTILNHELVLTAPAEPLVRVMGYGESSVNITTKTWCKNSDYWTVYFDLVEQVRCALTEAGIEIPYNQLEVRVKNNAS